MITVTIEEVINETVVSGGITVEIVAGGFNVEGVTATWGDITGTLADQTDLQAALDAKAATSHSHANAVASGAAGFMTGTDKAKLDGVATGATANATDAALRDRSTHTGTQALSTLASGGAATGQAIAWNGSAWVPTTVAASPGGSSGQLQYNNAGAFGGAALSWSSGASQLSGPTGWQIYSAHTPADGVGALTINSLNAPGSGYAGGERGYLRFCNNGYYAGSVGQEGGALAIVGSGNGLILSTDNYGDAGSIQVQNSGLRLNAHLNQYGLDTAAYAALVVLGRRTGGGTLTAADLIRVDSAVTNGLFAVNASGRIRYNAAASAPSNTTTPVTWAEFHVGSSSYRLPLYQ